MEKPSEGQPAATRCPGGAHGHERHQVDLWLRQEDDIPNVGDVHHDPSGYIQDSVHRTLP